MVNYLKEMCPFLRTSQITPQLISLNANKCPFMKLMGYSVADQSTSSIMHDKLKDPLNFMGLAAPSHNVHFTEAIHKLKAEGRYRVFTEIARQSGRFPAATEFMTGKKDEITVWCSNDYLGMGQNPVVVSAMKVALDSYGAGSGGTRNIGGNTHLHVQLETELAHLHSKESALVCTSGYVANEAGLGVLPSVFPGNVIYFSDAENHASMIQGMRHSRVNKGDIRVFKHNDIEHLEELLAQADGEECDKGKKKVIVFESVYSMSGSIAPLKQIKDLATHYNAMTYIDEVHGVGLYGKTGAGVCEERGVSMDIVSGTLGKAFGVHGGYLAGDREVIDCIRSFAAPFIFTTSVPPVTVAGALASIQYVRSNEREREMLHKHSKFLKERLQQENLPVMSSESHIVPLFIGSPTKCKEVSDVLLKEYRIYVQPINYPTVPRGEELLRLSPGPLHTPDKIEYFVAAVKEVWTRFGLTDYAEYHSAK